MDKKIYFAIFVSLMLISFGLQNVLANHDIPEKDGVYNVTGRPDLKVRVFVHKVKPGAPAPSQPVCELTDPDSSSVIGDAGWKLPSSFTYNVNLKAPSTIGSTNWNTIVSKSFTTWTNNNTGVNLSKGINTTVSKKGLDGKNIVAWGNASVSALGVTYIWYNPSTGLATEIDTIMNQKFPWMWSNSITCAYSNAYDAQNILTHEIGHWYGLDDEYTAEFVDNTMYGYGSKQEVKKNTLTTGDISILNSKY